MIDLDDVTVLVEATHAGSLSAAGRRIGITAMAASRRLASLEAELGARLIHRTTRSLSLTPEGEAFLPHARAMLQQEADGRAAVRPADAGASGRLRITASVPFGRKIVTPMMAGFLRANPEVRIELVLHDGIVDIVGQGIDLALRISALKDSSLVARRLGPSPQSLYASPEYLSARGRPRVLADLAEHECLVMPGITHWTFRRGRRQLQQRVRARFAADSVEALHQASLGGLGIARLSAWNVRDDLAARRLVPLVLTDAALPELSIWAVYPTARFVSPKVRLFMDAFKAHLRAH